MDQEKIDEGDALLRSLLLRVRHAAETSGPSDGSGHASPAEQCATARHVRWLLGQDPEAVFAALATCWLMQRWLVAAALEQGTEVPGVMR